MERLGRRERVTGGGGAFGFQIPAEISRNVLRHPGQFLCPGSAAHLSILDGGAGARVSGSVLMRVRTPKQSSCASFCVSQRMSSCTPCVSQQIFVCIRCGSQGPRFNCTQGTNSWGCRSPPPPPKGCGRALSVVLVGGVGGGGTRTTSHSPSRLIGGLHSHANKAAHAGPVAEQPVTTRSSLRREVTVQGPGRKPTRDEMSHRGGGGGRGCARALDENTPRGHKGNATCIPGTYNHKHADV